MRFDLLLALSSLWTRSHGHAWHVPPVVKHRLGTWPEEGRIEKYLLGHLEGANVGCDCIQSTSSRPSAPDIVEDLRGPQLQKLRFSQQVRYTTQQKMLPKSAKISKKFIKILSCSLPIYRSDIARFDIKSPSINLNYTWRVPEITSSALISFSGHI